MKQAELLKLSDQVWVRKRKGYRIQCRTYEETGRVSTLMPSENELPLESDVAGWRVAHKLSMAESIAADGKPEYIDITLVDDEGKNIPYYVTGRPEILNPDMAALPDEASEPIDASQPNDNS